jgi:hypothetical protein
MMLGWVKVLLRQGMGIDELSTKTTKFIKVAPDKYLLTCGDNLDRNFEVCRHTIYFDYGKQLVEKGSDFKYPHKNATVVPLKDKNTFMIIGGEHERKTFFIIPMYLTIDKPPANKRVQILRIK